MRQPQMDDTQFERIADLAYRESGIRLMREKKLMVQSRLRHRLRALNLDAFASYADHVISDAGAQERRFMISALTTNVSHFFREAQHFEMLTDRLLPAFRKRLISGQRIRIWSAGCSNGQEPYSIAMHLLKQEPGLAKGDFRILGTDIDPKVVAHADRGIYSDQQLRGIAKEDLAQFTTQVDDANGDRRMNDELRRIVTFHELNLFSRWPMQFDFDAIFCRNVVIYFDQATQEQLWPRFNSALAAGGLFFLGHSERIADPAMHGFTSAGPTAYAKSTTKHSMT